MDTETTTHRPMEQVLYEVKKVIVGQDVLLERLIVALLARGHVLVEGVPGLAKTMTIKTLAAAIGGQFQRIQFTPDLVPADLVGTRIYNQRTGEFDTSLGPVFTNLLLADEINRAPAKVQSALLEVMQERQVTIGRETHAVPDPFLVLATQNPIESEGTYPLPEAQVDRFMLKVLVGYPSPTEEFVIVERMTGPVEAVRRVVGAEDLVAQQRAADRVYVDPALIEYAVTLASATRDPDAHGLGTVAPYVLYGVSPRAAINLVLAAKALAYVRGRDYALPEDVRELALDVMRHRLVLSYEALADGVTADDLLAQVLARGPRPRRPAPRPRAHDRPCRATRPRLNASSTGWTGRVDPPARRTRARRLPHPAVRRGHRLRGPARVHAGRRRAPHRLERHRPHRRSPYVRQYVAERELTAWLLLDRSPSMAFGDELRTKDVVALEFVTAIARLLTRNGNRVGAILYDNTVEAVLEPRSGRNQVLRIARALMRPARDPVAATELGGLLGSRSRPSGADRSSSWSPTSSASPVGSARSRCSPGATRWSPCASSIRARSSSPMRDCS